MLRFFCEFLFECLFFFGFSMLNLLLGPKKRHSRSSDSLPMGERWTHVRTLSRIRFCSSCLRSFSWYSVTFSSFCARNWAHWKKKTGWFERENRLKKSNIPLLRNVLYVYSSVNFAPVRRCASVHGSLQPCSRIWLSLVEHRVLRAPSSFRYRCTIIESNIRLPSIMIVP